jgi:hypothetical protein
MHNLATLSVVASRISDDAFVICRGQPRIVMIRHGYHARPQVDKVVNCVADQCIGLKLDPMDLDIILSYVLARNRMLHTRTSTKNIRYLYEDAQDMVETQGIPYRFPWFMQLPDELANDSGLRKMTRVALAAAYCFDYQIDESVVSLMVNATVEKKTNTKVDDKIEKVNDKVGKHALVCNQRCSSAPPMRGRQIQTQGGMRRCLSAPAAKYVPRPPDGDKPARGPRIRFATVCTVQEYVPTARRAQGQAMWMGPPTKMHVSPNNAPFGSPIKLDE